MENKRIKETAVKLKRKALRLIRSWNKNICFSLGENCLPDELLIRYDLKSFSSPYASARSNVEYILAFEKERFSAFLDEAWLEYETVAGKKTARNTKYFQTENQYHPTCCNGFEFIHHDVLGDGKARKTMRRRCERMLNLRNKSITMLMHHRLCPATDMELLLRHLSALAKIYEERNNRVSIILFYQVIIPDESARRVETYQSGSVRVFTFYTTKEWAGTDEEVLWAKCDDDLIKTMIDSIKSNTF